MSSALGGTVVAFTLLAAVGIVSSIVIEAIQLKKTKSFRYLLTDTFYLFAFGGLLITIGYFFCFWDRHTAFEPIGDGKPGTVSHLRKGVGLAWGVFMCAASAVLLRMWKTHRGGQATLQTDTLSRATATPTAPASKETSKVSISKAFFKFKSKKNEKGENKEKPKAKS